MNRTLYEQNRLDTDAQACLVEPQVLAAGATATGWLGVAGYDKFMFVIMGGAAAGATDTLDVQINQATSNAGANAKVVAGKAITQVVAGAGFATLNDIWYIHLDISELDVDNFFAFVNATITVSAQDTWAIAAFCLREHRVFEEVPTTNVTEIVN